ncbi:hypothetical protein P7F88_16360 [Vibrio hannami]|nr:hypothetical protein [Vibrio hannami]MDG3087550.1 hypothetical protein [Vibrio hannami]
MRIVLVRISFSDIICSFNLNRVKVAGTVTIGLYLTQPSEN